MEAVGATETSPVVTAQRWVFLEPSNSAWRHFCSSAKEVGPAALGSYARSKGGRTLRDTRPTVSCCHCSQDSLSLLFKSAWFTWQLSNPMLFWIIVNSKKWVYGIWSVVSSYYVCIGIRKLSAMLKATQGLHSHYDGVNMGPYSESVIQNISMKLSVRSVEWAWPAMMLLWRTTLLMSQWIYCSGESMGHSEVH